MKRIIIIATLFFSATLSAENSPLDNSITVHNVSEKNKIIWVNGTEYSIEIGNSLRVPCYAGDLINVQSVKTTNFLTCGSSQEIDNEY